MQVDVLVSWNFKHIVNLDRIRGYMSADMRDMTFEEQRVYIDQHASQVRAELELRHESAAAQKR